MYSHNSQVTANIADIKARVESANSQDELVSIIQDVENHTGPLDYDDTPYRIYCWLHLSMVVLMLLEFFLAYRLGSMGIIFLPVSWFIGFSSLWLPAVSLYVLWTLLDDRNIRLPLPEGSKKPWVRGLVSLGLGIGLWFLPVWHFLYWEYFSTLSRFVGGYDASFGLGIHALVVGGLLWFWLRKRAKWRDPVSEQIFIMDALFNNQLKPVKCDGEAMAKQLGEDFREFIRGNDIRRIKNLYEGSFAGSDHSFQYQMYCFHYVRKRTETYTDSKGNTRTRTVRDHYYRHGFLLDFPYAKGLSLDADRSIKFSGEKYRGTSNEFNREFKVRAHDTMNAARLLTPAVEERLVAFAKAFKSPVVEITPNGRLCLAVTDDLLAIKRKHGLENPKEFAEEIAGHTELQKVQDMLDLIHDLMRFSDNNFTTPYKPVTA